LPAALAFFHRNFAAAEILALPAADILRLGFFTFAQRFFWQLLFAHCAKSPQVLYANSFPLIDCCAYP
jgi:hypothetical protein